MTMGAVVIINVATRLRGMMSILFNNDRNENNENDEDHNSVVIRKCFEDHGSQRNANNCWFTSLECLSALFFYFLLISLKIFEKGPEFSG